ncbi:MAG: GldG family protein [Myxococcaceae bacterium]|nr:GldG family protein [Myxococcaceae bacterium]
MLKTLGKVGGGVGLLLTLTSFVTLFVTSGSMIAFGVKLGLGVALLALWAVTNSDKISLWARSVFFFGSSAAIGAVFLALMVAANFIVARRNQTWDLTSKKLYSLSQQTRDTLKDLKEPINIIVFSTGELPESLDDLFKRFAAETEKLTWERKDPRKTPALVAKYKIREQQFAAILVRKPGQSDESSTAANLPRLADAAEGEQELTNALIRLQTVGEQKVYFLEGHGEIPLELEEGAMPQAPQPSLAKVKTAFMNEGYVCESLNLAKDNAIPQDAKVLVSAGAKSAYTEGEKRLIEQFLEEGGRFLYFAEAGYEPSLDPVLAKYGLQIDNGVIADPRVDPDQPYLIVAPFYGDHVTVAPLKAGKLNLLFFSARAITVLREGTLQGVTALNTVLTTPEAWLETKPDEDPKLDPGEKAGQLGVVAVSTRDSTAANKRSEQTRIVAFGDSQVLLDLFALEGDRNLVLNAMGWLSNQPKKLTIRPPDRDISSLQVDGAMLSNIRLVVMDVLPMLLIGVGLTVWLTRRSR